MTTIDGPTLDALVDALRETSADEPVTAAELADRVGIDDGATSPAVREAVKDLMRTRALPIASGPNGYFWMHTAAELERYLANLDRRIAGIQERKRLACRAFNRARMRERERARA